MISRIALFIFLCAPLFADEVLNISWQEVLDFAVVINLDRSPDRFECASALLEKAGFTNIERFSAIDGKSANPAIFKELNISSKIKPGERGCAASHLIIWKNLIDSEKELLFVLEDDVLPHSQFKELFPLYWEKTPKNFDIVMVGCSISPSKPSELIVKLPTVRTHAYIISKTGAKKLLTLYLSQNPKRPLDCVIDQFIYNQMKALKINYCVYNGMPYPDPLYKDKAHYANPRRDHGICFQNPQFDSTIN